MSIGILLTPYFTTPYRSLSFNRGRGLAPGWGFRFCVSGKPVAGDLGLRSRSWEMGI